MSADVLPYDSSRLTPRMPASINPVHVGVYRCHVVEYGWAYSLWNGKAWEPYKEYGFYPGIDLKPTIRDEKREWWWHGLKSTGSSSAGRDATDQHDAPGQGAKP